LSLTKQSKAKQDRKAQWFLMPKNRQNKFA
jgi:hypothetical protein